MKKTLLATAVLMASTSAMAAWTSSDGNLTIGGDAEMNFDVINNDKGIGRDDKTSTQLGDDSRFLLDIAWMNTQDNGAFVTARAQPLIRADGKVEVDDVYFGFGMKDAWMFQIGRYEAMDLFPLGKDVAVFYAAGSDGIGDGVYYYMAKEGRGRSDDAGQARVVGEFGNWTAEVSTVYGDTSGILSGSLDYLDDGNKIIESDNNSFMIRPAVNYLSDDGFVSVSFGGEYEANKDSVSVTNKETGEIYDLSHRYGLSATTTLNFGDLKWHTSAAYQDAKEAWKAQTFNTNIEYLNAFGLGTSFAKNDFKTKAHDAKSYIVYTTYTMPILGFNNAEVSFALSYSETKNAYGMKGNDEETVAFRTRFNYYF
ncbi:carbohydrate porin [Endozoicomonas arenosclerae]|uniref:carbohydrate porin n=1 Tax=Endozoicomonas arenosclerae TaxID=1633495 RepID=UPI000785FD2F|nr:carbohydrate porin [Endozoicomonas arenosclerae]